MTLLNKITNTLSSWVIDEKIEDTECARLLLRYGLTNDEAEYLMEVVNDQRVSKIGVEQMIIDDLDQSNEFDDDIDGFKYYLAEKLEIEYDTSAYEDPYQNYLRYESGV